jgi:hypothetical protein
MHDPSASQSLPALGLLRWDLQPLASPDALDPLVVDYPARLAQQFGNLAIAVAAVLPGKRDNVGRQTLLVVTTARDLALCRAVLPERRTGATLGDMQLRSDLLDAGTATVGGLVRWPRVSGIQCRTGQIGNPIFRGCVLATSGMGP